MRKASVETVIDNAITSTMSRTMITHGSTLLMVLSIFFFGGETLPLLLARAGDRHLLRHLLVGAGDAPLVRLARACRARTWSSRSRKKALEGEKILP